MVLSFIRPRRGNLFTVKCSAPAGAIDNSQGDQPIGRCPPLVLAKMNRQPCKGGRRLLSPFQGSAQFYRQFQGLAPLANDCRRSAAECVATHRLAARWNFKFSAIGHSLTYMTVSWSNRRTTSLISAGRLEPAHEGWEVH
jgi:hypothetical protein